MPIKSTLVSALAALWGGRLRFEAVMALGRALVVVGCPAVAAWIYGQEITRVEKWARALAGRDRR